jgi:hypothetical protein
MSKSRCVTVVRVGESYFVRPVLLAAGSGLHPLSTESHWPASE